VIRVLWDLYQRDEIGFHDLGRPSLHARFRRGRHGHDLRVNTAYLNTVPQAIRFPRLSLLLVHEGTHAAVRFTDLYDELAARILPIYYFRELTGPGVFNEATDPPRPGQRTQTVRLGPLSMPLFEEQSEALRHDQLIDWVLSNEHYTKERYVDAQWIVDNLTHWGGLGNRRPATRGLYIRILAQETDTYFTRAIIDIMESVSSRTAWDAMMAEAGSRQTIGTALRDLKARQQYAPRISGLERRWGVPL
jgi:hypothetical protein